MLAAERFARALARCLSGVTSATSTTSGAGSETGGRTGATTEVGNAAANGFSRTVAADQGIDGETDRAEAQVVTLFDGIVAAAAECLPVDDIALVLRTSPLHLQLMSTAGATSAGLEDLQVMLGEGPTVDAYRSSGPVLVADLSRLQHGRWPVFEAALTTADAGSLTTLPLQLGAIRLGVLSLYRHEPGDLSDKDLADMLAVAQSVTTLLLLSGQGPPSEQETASWLAESASSNVINQATGMVMAQLGLSSEEAYARLRSFAFAEGRPLHDMAQDVVDRQVRLAPSGET